MVVNFGCWVIDRWRLDYNHHRIHSSLDYQTLAAYADGCVLPDSATPQPPEHNRITNPDSDTHNGAILRGRGKRAAGLGRLQTTHDGSNISTVQHLQNTIVPRSREPRTLHGTLNFGTAAHLTESTSTTRRQSNARQ